MKKILLIFILLIGFWVRSQKIALDVGKYDPMTTTEMNALASPEEGWKVYNTTTKTVWNYDGTVWINAGSGGGSETDPVFTASDAFPITAAFISNWDAAHGWGNHSLVGYALDVDVVKLTGPQDILGVKSFKQRDIEIYNDGTSSGQATVQFYPQSGSRYGNVGYFNSAITLDNDASNEDLKLLDTGGLQFTGLTGTGTEMLTVDSTGNFGRQAIPSGGGTDDQTAAEVAITDAGGYWASSDVEGALQDIGGEIATLPINATQLPYNNTTSGLTATNTNAAIDELAATASSGNPIGYTYQTISADNQINAISSTVKTWVKIDDDYTYLLNNTEPLGLPFIIQATENVTTEVSIERNNSAFKYHIDGDAVTYVADDVDGFKIARGRSVTVIREANNLYSVTGSASDPYSVASCTADPNENFTVADAGSDPNCNEADSTAGWTTNGATGLVFQTSTDASVGSYSLQITSPTNTSSYMRKTITASSGDTFDISFDHKSNNGTLYVAITNQTGYTAQYYTETGWTSSGTISVTATGDMEVRVYTHPGTGGSPGTPHDNKTDNWSAIKTN